MVVTVERNLRSCICGDGMHEGCCRCDAVEGSTERQRRIDKLRVEAGHGRCASSVRPATAACAQVWSGRSGRHFAEGFRLDPHTVIGRDNVPSRNADSMNRNRAMLHVACRGNAKRKWKSIVGGPGYSRDRLAVEGV